MECVVFKSSNLYNLRFHKKIHYISRHHFNIKANMLLAVEQLCQLYNATASADRTVVEGMYSTAAKERACTAQQQRRV